jgi:hypothetical protein
MEPMKDTQAAVLLGALLKGVVELARSKGLYLKAQQAVVDASQAGVPSQELLEELARRESELHEWITMLEHHRLQLLDAQAEESLPFVAEVRP